MERALTRPPLDPGRNRSHVMEKTVVFGPGCLLVLSLSCATSTGGSLEERAPRMRPLIMSARRTLHQW